MTHDNEDLWIIINALGMFCDNIEQSLKLFGDNYPPPGFDVEMLKGKIARAKQLAVEAEKARHQLPNHESYFSPKDFPITPEFQPTPGLTGKEAHKEFAIAQFIARYHQCKHRAKKNEDRPAGDPMVYFCRHCGMVSDILPEDFFKAMPRSTCSMCDRMEGPWIEEAINKAEGV